MENREIHEMLNFKFFNRIFNFSFYILHLKKMLQKELETAIKLAKTAGDVILEFYALEIIAEEKYGIDNFSEPVTIADRTASKIIVEGLAEAFPGRCDFVRRRKGRQKKSSVERSGLDD